MSPGQGCQVGGHFSRCPNLATETCQYCGRSFCPAHTAFVADHQAVCSRKPCRAKHQDLQDHVAYKLRIQQRNRAGLCGIENCEPHPALECSLCQGRFCGRHLSDRLYPFRTGMVSIERPVSVCDHCWGRRHIWRSR